jgi:hypothetical protein
LTQAGLLNEINTGPLSATLIPLAKTQDDQGIADALNADNAAYQVPSSPIPSQNFMDLIAANELASLTVSQLTQLQVIVTPGLVGVGNANVQAWIVQTFPPQNAPTTNAALTALATRAGSRAEWLWGIGTQITATDVAEAIVNYVPPA